MLFYGITAHKSSTSLVFRESLMFSGPQNFRWQNHRTNVPEVADHWNGTRNGWIPNYGAKFPHIHRSAHSNGRHTDKRRIGRVILIKNLHSFRIVYWSGGERVDDPCRMSQDLGNERVSNVVIPREQRTFIETGRFEVRKTFGIHRLRARWNFCGNGIWKIWEDILTRF